MKKTYLFWFAILAFLLLGCRNDHFNPNETNTTQQALKFRVVPKSEIPQIINELQAKTDHFKVPLKYLSSEMGKTETVFGEINTDYIIETTNGTDEVFYTFSVRPTAGHTGSETYNLEMRADGTDMPTAKVFVYEPTAEWKLNGNNDYLTFSGTKSTYSLEGTLENTVTYLAGMPNCEPEEPCPDCPVTPQGPGGGTGGNGGGIPGGGAGGGGGTNTDPGNDPGPSSPGGGTQCPFCIERDQDTGSCTQWIMVSCTGGLVGKQIKECPTNGGEGGGGGVIVIYDETKTPCAKTKALIERADVKPKLEQLYTKAKSTGGGELGFMIKNNGTPTDMIPGGAHSVKFDMTGSKGIYHNHTNKPGEEGIKMVSPRDIHALFQFIGQQAAGTLTNDAFVGMVGAKKCAVANDCPPDGYEMFNYVIRFSGTAQQAAAINGTTYDFKGLSDDYRKFEQSIGTKPGYGSQYGNYTSTKGVEELFFYILGKMGIEKSQMTLQRIDKNGNVTNVTLGTDGKPKDTACQ